jgi:hypothetical protein
MSDLTVTGPETVAPAAPVAPVAPAAVPAPKRPSVFRRVLARVSSVEAKVLHDPLVQKDGRALVAALVVRVLLAAGASDGVVALVRAVLPHLGV